MESERRTMAESRRLTAREVMNAKPPPDRRAVVMPDGGNLYLQVSRSKDDKIWRSWVFRYELDGRRHDLGLGPLHTLDLAEARTKAKTLRQQLLDGIDPLSVKQEARRARLARLAAEQRAMTFRACAEACMAAHENAWTNAKHRAEWRSTLERFVYPIIGDLAVDDITTAHVVKVLEPIWKEVPETASRVRGRMEKVFGWASVRGFRSGDNPARWRGHLAELFPARGKVQSVEHHAALPYSDVPTLMAELRAENRPSSLALEFLILTAARTGEVRRATWDEFNLAAKMWVVPAKHMKSGKEHRVPLPDRAVEILRARPRNEVPFPIGPLGMADCLKRHQPGITVHGFRSSFRDWAAERTAYPNHVVEQALAHTISSKVEAAYRRTDLFEKRRKLMADWAAWCARPVPIGATVTPIAAGVR
jgi:integrase